MDVAALDQLTAAFEAERERLRKVASVRVSPMLLKRVTVDDVLQETWVAATKRLEAFVAQPQIPAFVRLRTLLLQTITDLERHYLAAQKRDAYKDVEMDAPMEEGGEGDRWDALAVSMTSPRTKLEREERYALVRSIIRELSDTDRTILELRHFEELSNAECAAVLGIAEKAASIRYVRALKKLQERLAGVTGFNTHG